jgi:hypothetical protein
VTHAVVESQAVTESPEDFVLRVGRRLQKLHAQQVALEYAVIACSERLDVSARTARARLCRLLCQKMIESGGGELILSAADHVAEPIRLQLFELAGALVDEFAGAPVSVSVRFVATSNSAVRVVRPSEPGPVSEAG